VSPERPFRFRLERVRELRERGEDVAREELAGALQAREAGRAALAAAGARLAAARAGHRSATGDGAGGRDLLAHQAWLEAGERAERAAQLELHRLDAQVEACQAALRQAAQERHVLERLKDRKQAEHAREAERRQGALLDELSLAMHRRGGAAA